ncbi:MAG: glycosyltransferase [Mycobacteriales bacterium]
MRVVFGGYPSNRWTPGGKERLLHDAATELRELGVDVELLDPWGSADHHFDVLHLWGSEHYQHEMGIRAKARGAGLLVTSILVYPTTSVERRTRWWRYVDPLVPLATSFSLRRDLLQMADLVVCLARDEIEQVQTTYGVPADRIRLVPATASSAFRSATPDLFLERVGIDDPVLCVARVEPRKNTLALVRAAREVGLPLVLIGELDPNHASYCAAVMSELDRLPAAAHIPFLAPDDPLIPSAYAAARVHALVSHSEQIGVSSLEAGLAGATLVVSQLPSTREVFGELAWYVDPHDQRSIEAALQAAYAAPRTSALAEHLDATYSSRAAARRLKGLYADVCSERRGPAIGRVAQQPHRC